MFALDFIFPTYFFPFLIVSRDTPESDNDNDATCAELKADEGWRTATNNNNNVNGATMNNTYSNNSFNSMNNNSMNSMNQRPHSLCSEPEIRWVDLVSVPLMMAYVTRYIYGTDKLRTNAFEVRGLNGTSTGVIHLDDLAILSSWLKYITDNIVGLTNLQVTIFNNYLNFFFNNFFPHFVFTDETV